MKATLHFFWQQYDWEDVGGLFAVSGNDKIPEVYENKDRIFLRTVEIDVPNIEEPTRDQIARAKVAALKTERQAIMAESQMKLNAIDDKIKQLSCIEYMGDKS
jgi:hypothetical protein